MAEPHLIAHRGASLERPENTIPAFLRALELRADGIELDVHDTSDGVVVVLHDATPRAAPLDPSLAGRPIATLSLGELEAWRVDGVAGIPTLGDVLAAIAGRSDVYVELKATGIEDLVVRAIRESPAPERCAVHAFDRQAIQRVRALAPELRTGVLVSTYPTQPEALLRDTRATDLWPEFPCIGERLVARVHDAGGRVIAWTVNDPDVAVRLAAMGVDGLCTDDIPAIRTALSPTT